MFALQRTAISIREDVHQETQEVRGGVEGVCKAGVKGRREDLLSGGGSCFGFIHLSSCFAVATVTVVTIRSRYADSMKLRPFVYSHGFS